LGFLGGFFWVGFLMPTLIPADMEMVLILANLLASYNLLLAPGDEKEMGTQVLTIFLPDLLFTVPDRVPELPAEAVRQARSCP
jgi:hypothetical protein